MRWVADNLIPDGNAVMNTAVYTHSRAQLRFDLFADN